mmetsp:Transcript_24494/g.61267  ORF Transcript_24494/g.61267 Transcript_24494/m.61267 type:complete len:316 (+) Transcript_24494:280-1227(+)
MAHLAAPPTSPRRLRNRTRAVSLQAPELPLKHAHFDAGATACLAFHLAALLPPLDAHLPGTHCRHAKRALLKAPELLHERLRVGAAPHYALVPDSPLLLLLLLILFLLLILLFFFFFIVFVFLLVSFFIFALLLLLNCILLSLVLQTLSLFLNLLLGLFLCLFQFLLPLRNHFLPLLFQSLQNKSLISNVLLLLQHQLLAVLLEFGGWPPHHDPCNPLEHACGEVSKELLPLILHEVALDLHSNKIPSLQRGDGVHRLPNAIIIQLCNLETHVRLVVASFCSIPLRPPNAAVLGPIQDHAITQFHVRPVLFQEHV